MAETGGGFASDCDIWNFPMVARWSCRSSGRSEGARAGAHRGEPPQRENNRRAGTAWGAAALNGSAGWSAPQPPTPHPSGERPWLFSAPGSSFFTAYAEGHGTRRPARDCLLGAPRACATETSRACPNSVGTRSGSAPGWRTSSLRDETRRIFPLTFASHPTTRLSRCTISVRPPKPRIERMSAEERPLIRAASSAS